MFLRNVGIYRSLHGAKTRKDHRIVTQRYTSTGVHYYYNWLDLYTDYTLNLSDKTSEIFAVAMFVIINLQDLKRMFMI